MSDTELRMKIARLRGWRFDPSGMWLGPADIAGSRLASYFCPDWPNSIADAWELFAELPAKKALICRGNNQWTCGCNGEDSQLVCESETLEIEHYPIENTADAAARAVALTWLAWNGEKKMTDQIVRNLYMVMVKAGDSFESMSIMAKRVEVVDGDLMIFDYAPPYVSKEGKQQDWLVQAFKAGYWLSITVQTPPKK